MLLFPHPLAILLILAIGATSRDVRMSQDVQLQVPEEREIITREKLDAYMADKEDNTGDIVDIAKTTIESISTLSRINYTQSGGQIAWEVTNAIVPLIGAALAFIPGVGVIVSGLFLGLWSLISPLFAPKKDNPMEKMIKELAQQMEKKMDDKLKNVINLAIYGEIARNNYICNKYNYIAQPFTELFKKNTSLKAMDAMKLNMYLNDCDNFLKDTAEAFVYDDYADVLWVPGALTTTVRLAFLAEIVKNGHLMGLTRQAQAMYNQELKKDTQRQFDFHSKGMEKIYRARVCGTPDCSGPPESVSSVERASCTLQGQFFYFDRQIYSYGMPTILNNTDMFATIKMADHYNPAQSKDSKVPAQSKGSKAPAQRKGSKVRAQRKGSKVPAQSKGSEVKHLQIFFNVTNSTFPSQLPKRNEPYQSLEYMNCFFGPINVRSPNAYWFNFYAMPENNRYSYEFRVMYLERNVWKDGYAKHQRAVPLLSVLNTNSPKFDTYKNVHDKTNKNSGGDTYLNIEFIYPDHAKFNESKKLIDTYGWAHWKKCPFPKVDTNACRGNAGLFEGTFKMYSAGTFNHRSEKLNSLIGIDGPTFRYSYSQTEPYAEGENFGFLVGLEIILRPSIV